MKLEQQVPANDGDEDILVRAFEDIVFLLEFIVIVTQPPSSSWKEKLTNV